MVDTAATQPATTILTETAATAIATTVDTSLGKPTHMTKHMKKSIRTEIPSSAQVQAPSSGTPFSLGWALQQGYC